jgi:pimeloyl-ACP methyl ester carboxylesterase
VFIVGGPAINEINPATAERLAGLPFARERDVVLYNQRGVGFARPRLGCPEFDVVRAAAFPREAGPRRWLAAVRACRRRLVQAGAKLDVYTAAQDAADLDALRRALLGRGSWNVYALSAGALIGLTAMRLRPAGIRSVILDSPQGTTFKLRGPDVWGSADRVLEKVFAECATDARCDAAHPRLRARFYRRVHALRRHPAHVRLPVFADNAFRRVVGGDQLLLDAATCAGNPFCAPGLPARLEAAARGRVGGYYAGTVLTPPTGRDVSTAEGKAAVSRCHDQIAFERDSELRAAARTLVEWRAHLRTLRFIYVPQLTRQACRIWNVGRARRRQHRPVVSASPTLVLTGEWDGTVWPREGRRIADHLQNAFFYEFPGIGHATLSFAQVGRDCPARIAAAFLDEPGTRPDAGCVAEMPRLVVSP